MDLTQIDIDGNKLKALRKERALTFNYVGNAVGVLRGTIYSYEKGLVAPSAKVLARLCIFFNVPIQDLITFKSSAKTHRAD